MHKVECKDVFEKCEKTLSEAITNLGMAIFSVIDHGKNADSVGLKLGRTKLIVFGNPNAGTLLMQVNREIGYDLPLRILIWEEGGRVFLSFKLPSEIAKEHGIENLEVVKKMDAVFNKVLESAIG